MCPKVAPSGIPCADATPAKGLNGRPIQIGTYTASQGECPVCTNPLLH